VWPIEERPVPQTSVPGEKTSPTQPFPTKPPPFARQGFTTDDLIDFTPELRAEALKIVADYTLGPLFTPPTVVGENGKKGVLQIPSAAGGANWGGAGFDPETGYLFLQSANIVSLAAVVKNDGAQKSAYTIRGAAGPPGPQGLPLIKPPYGVVTQTQADLSLSTTELFLRAFDKKSGAVVWEHRMKEPPFGTPMTYLHKGRQYLIVATGGAGTPGRLVAFALPAGKK
jgi:quinoprotein glucose dehydrogenase